MVRGLMVVLALTATAVHGQEAKAAESADAAIPGGGDRALVLASRSTPEPRSYPLARSAGSFDGGADARVVTTQGTSSAADCSLVEAFRSGGAPVVRTYQMPPREPQVQQENAWDQPPYVAAVARCGHLYIFQVMSQSADAWSVDRTRLEGPKGEVVQVIALRFSEGKEGWSINVIVAEAPAGVKPPRLKLHLTGQDGRVAQPEARDLP